MDREKFLLLFVGGQLAHVFVVFAVVAQVVARSQDRLYIFRIIFYPAAGHKKGGMDIFFLKNIQDLLRVFVSPGGVEGQRHLFLVRLHTVNGELAAVCGAGPGNGYGLRGKQPAGLHKSEDSQEEETVFECVRMYGVP